MVVCPLLGAQRAAAGERLHRHTLLCEGSSVDLDQGAASQATPCEGISITLERRAASVAVKVGVEALPEPVQK